MAYRKIEEASLTAVADAIRGKTGASQPLLFPDEFVSAIAGIQTGSSVPAHTEELMTLTQPLSISDILSTVKYKYKIINSVIIIDAYGDTKPPQGEYTINHYVCFHCGTFVVKATDRYKNGLVSPNSFFADGQIGGTEEERRSTISADGVISCAATSSPMGGAGTKILLKEIPVDPGLKYC